LYPLPLVAAPAERPAAAHLLSFFPDIPLTIDDYITQRNAAQDAHWPRVQLLPGVARLVAHLTAHNVPIAIATGSSRRNFALKTSHLQHVFAHFGSNVICGSDDGAGRSKPFPDVFLAAARRLGRAVGSIDEEGDVVGEKEREERARGLVFEDAFPGVMGGKRAGMSGAFIHLPHPFVFFSQVERFPVFGRSGVGSGRESTKC
jgi:pseudouridine 5'-phosphatase